MAPFILLLTYIALCDLTLANLDLGPARIDFDVFMTLEHGVSSRTIGSTTTEPTSNPTTRYSESTQPALHAISVASSCIGSAWRDLTDGSQDSHLTQTMSFEPTHGPTTQFIEPTHPAPHPISKTTSRILSAWNDMGSSMYESDPSTQRTVSVALQTAFYEPVDSASTSQSDHQAFPVDVPDYAETSGKYATRNESLAVTLTAASTSCVSRGGDSSQANVTSTWSWPPITSASPTPSDSNLTNPTHSISPAIAQNNVDGKTKPETGVWCLAMVLALAAEARGQL